MKKLTKNEMKNVMGGVAHTGCCAHTGGWGDYQCGYSTGGEARQAASDYAIANGVQTFYCCDCASSPGYPGPGAPNVPD